MPVQTVHVDAWEAGSMNDRIDPVLHRGGMLEELRNVKFMNGDWERDDGWSKVNAATIPGTGRWLGIFSYSDRNRTPHVIAVNSNGHVYHDLDWYAPVSYLGAATWDATAVASFAAWRDNAYICIARADGTATTLRYDGILGTLSDIGIDPPATALTAVDNGVVPGGLVPAGDYLFGYTYYDPTTTWESAMSPTTALVVALDGSSVALSNILVSTNADATSRRLYWSINGEDFYRIDDDVPAEMGVVGTTYALNLAEPSTSAYVDRAKAGNYITCATLPSGIIAWCGCSDDNKPAMIQFSLDPDNPEALRLDENGDVYYSYAGHDDDPIVGAKMGRDGALIVKKRSTFWLHAATNEIEGLLPDVGGVSWASIQAVGSSFFWWTVRGPVTLEHTNEQDFTFVGPDRYRFALSGTVADIQEDRLRYVGSVHNSARGIIAWFVQMCGDWSLYGYGPHSNLLNQPTAAPVATVPAPGVPDPVADLAPGDYSFRYTYYEPATGLESEGSPVVSVNVPAAGIQAIGHTIVSYPSPAGRTIVARCYWSSNTGIGVGGTGVMSRWYQTLNPAVNMVQFTNVLAADAEGSTYIDTPLSLGEHADTAVVWDYAFKNENSPRGILYLRDLIIDYACPVPLEDTDAVEYWGCFPVGFIGKLWDGQHGDGTDAMAYAVVTSINADGTISIDESTLGASDVNVWGTVAYTTQFCQPVVPCFRPSRMILRRDDDSALGNRLYVCNIDGIAVGDTIWFGGFKTKILMNGVGGAVPGRVKRFHYAEVQIKGSINP